MFRGIYNGSRKHIDDLHEVLRRAVANGVDKVIVFFPFVPNTVLIVFTINDTKCTNDLFFLHFFHSKIKFQISLGVRVYTFFPFWKEVDSSDLFILSSILLM